MAELPDEDTFVIPDAWRDRIHPRRNGAPGLSAPVGKVLGMERRGWERARAGDGGNQAGSSG